MDCGAIHEAESAGTSGSCWGVGQSPAVPFVLLRQIQLFGENCLRDEPENRIDGGFNRRSADERTVKRFQLPVWAAEQADGELAETIYEGLCGGAHSMSQRGVYGKERDNAG